jgi:hypothetical protein
VPVTHQPFTRQSSEAMIAAWLEVSQTICASSRQMRHQKTWSSGEGSASVLSRMSTRSWSYVVKTISAWQSSPTRPARCQARWLFSYKIAEGGRVALRLGEPLADQRQGCHDQGGRTLLRGRPPRGAPLGDELGRAARVFGPGRARVGEDQRQHLEGLTQAHLFSEDPTCLHARGLQSGLGLDSRHDIQGK